MVEVALMDAPLPTVTSDEGEPKFIFCFCERPTVVLKSRARTHGVYRHQTNRHEGARSSKKKEPPRNQTRVAWQMAWKARQKRCKLWRAMVSIMWGELISSSEPAVPSRRKACAKALRRHVCDRERDGASSRPRLFL